MKRIIARTDDLSNGALETFLDCQRLNIGTVGDPHLRAIFFTHPEKVSPDLRRRMTIHIDELLDMIAKNSPPSPKPEEWKLVHLQFELCKLVEAGQLGMVVGEGDE